MTTLERVKVILKDAVRGLEDKDVTMEAELMNDIGLDSLDFVEVVMAVEEEFDVAIEDEVAERFRTVRDVVEYIDGDKGE